MPFLTVLTAHGDAVYEVPTGTVATIWGGFELDTDLLSGKGATLCTDPRAMGQEGRREKRERWKRANAGGKP